VSSYIPTLHSLIKARTNWDPIPRNELAGLIICEDSPKSSVANYLPEAAKEVHIVRQCFESVHAQVLNTVSTHTMRAELLSLLENTPAHVLHLACHGTQDADPLNRSGHDARFWAIRARFEVAASSKAERCPGSLKR
jgi:CHAT domain-containing protein